MRFARRHGQPFALELTGPAVRRFTSAGSNDDATVVDTVMDKVEFCSVLAGRGERAGLLSTIVPF